MFCNICMKMLELVFEEHRRLSEHQNSSSASDQAKECSCKYTTESIYGTKERRNEKQLTNVEMRSLSHLHCHRFYLVQLKHSLSLRKCNTKHHTHSYRLRYSFFSSVKWPKCLNSEIAECDVYLMFGMQQSADAETNYYTFL